MAAKINKGGKPQADPLHPAGNAGEKNTAWRDELKAQRWPLLLMAGLIVADQLSKWWVRASLELYELRELVPGLFNLVYYTNSGAAFGLLAGESSLARQLLFVGVAVLALGLLFYLYRQVREQGGLPVYALSLIAAGAIGNLIDRVLFAEVTDFLDFHWRGYHWPAFNVADSAITIGVGLFLILSLRGER